MLNIDTTTMLIELTRGDTASIVFSAKDKEGKTYIPSDGDVLKLSVAKKVGAEPIMNISSPPATTPELYVEITLTEDEFNLEKERFYVYDSGEYHNCSDPSYDTYNSATTYYILDYSNFWTLTIESSDWVDDGGNDLFKFKDYVFDVQLKTADGQVDTIIGETDSIHPTFRVLGEVATE